MHTLNLFVSYCFGDRWQSALEILEKLDDGTPLHVLGEEHHLDPQAIEGLNAYMKLRDAMDAAMNSEDCIIFFHEACSNVSLRSAKEKGNAAQ